jgi:BirA family biotin operon repressor/biotin-[acetyl-CoA-carboxylase] ligase
MNLIVVYTIHFMKIKTISFQSLDSTNEWAKRNCSKFAKDEITLIKAFEQTSGKGRFSRVWHSPMGENFYGSFCTLLNGQTRDIGLSSLVLALSVCEVAKQLGADLQLKWPNDLMLGQKKIGGILGESIHTLSGVVLILGLGFNLNLSVAECTAIDQPATSLFAHFEKHFSLEKFQELLSERFLFDFTLFQTEGFSPFIKTYEERLTLRPEQKIRLRYGVEGKFIGLNPDGTLEVKLPSGEQKTITSGSLLESIE